MGGDRLNLYQAQKSRQKLPPCKKRRTQGFHVKRNRRDPHTARCLGNPGHGVAGGLGCCKEEGRKNTDWLAKGVGGCPQKNPKTKLGDCRHIKRGEKV